MDLIASNVKAQDIIYVNSIYKNPNPSPQSPVWSGSSKVALRTLWEVIRPIQSLSEEDDH